jgi:hypothetical protein
MAIPQRNSAVRQICFSHHSDEWISALNEPHQAIYSAYAMHTQHSGFIHGISRGWCPHQPQLKVGADTNLRLKMQQASADPSAQLPSPYLFSFRPELPFFSRGWCPHQPQLKVGADNDLRLNPLSSLEQ